MATDRLIDGKQRSNLRDLSAGVPRPEASDHTIMARTIRLTVARDASCTGNAPIVEPEDQSGQRAMRARRIRRS